MRTPTGALAIANFQELVGKPLPFRASFVGIIAEKPEEVEVTVSGEMKQAFVLVDGFENWLRCVAHGAHADTEILAQMNKVVVFFGSARQSLGSAPPAIWIFKDAFIVLLSKAVVHAPMT
eukprot:16133187-Heterocapsa_arctica.AAC.1